jgi:hypothetical protein
MTCADSIVLRSVALLLGTGSVGRTAFAISTMVLTLAFGCGGRENQTNASDASDATVACTDANVETISASDYDQSCNVDSDCVAVGEGNACFPCTIICKGAPISRGALPAYQSDVSKTIGARETESVSCGCPLESTPCCRSGVCTASCN